MRKSKYTVMFAVFFILLLLTIASAGCEGKGVKGFIYHDKDLVATTQCDDDLRVSFTPDTITIKTKYLSKYGLYDKDIYQYLNDGKYHVERKECTK